MGDSAGTRSVLKPCAGSVLAAYVHNKSALQSDGPQMVSASSRNTPDNYLIWLIATAAAGLMGCHDQTPRPPPTPSVVSSPAKLNLYPVQSSTDEDRLFIKVTAIGGIQVDMPLAFDTGSAGITLYAPDVLPGMADSSGFSFQEGQTTIEVDGLIVTRQEGARVYGSSTNGKTEIGNLGYATITFGDSEGQLTTAVMPVFLYYQIVDNGTGQLVPAPPQRGWFGVNSAYDIINAGTAKPEFGYPACTQGVVGSCLVASVLKYIKYVPGLDAGFRVDPAPLQPCEIDSPGACTPKPMLTIGLTPTDLAAFSTAPLTCTSQSQIGGFSNCSNDINDATVSLRGGAGTFSGGVLFDSGTPSIVLYPPSGSDFPSIQPGTMITVQTPTPSSFTYSFTSSTATVGGFPAPDAVQVIGGSIPQGVSIIGLAYFTTNAFIIDFSTGTEGWQQ
jgi:hypothetical protein